MKPAVNDRIRAWWFGGDVLDHGDGRAVIEGETLRVDPPPALKSRHKWLLREVHDGRSVYCAKCGMQIILRERKAERWPYHVIDDDYYATRDGVEIGPRRGPTPPCEWWKR